MAEQATAGPQIDSWIGNFKDLAEMRRFFTADELEEQRQGFVDEAVRKLSFFYNERDELLKDMISAWTGLCEK